ncbi:MAG: MgtC/SapB family protein [Chthoniobacterales bacterium]
MVVDLIVLQQLAVAFGLGLLLGLQRERAESSIGGIRTFPLIALFGTVCALLGKTFGGWLVAAGLLALVAIVLYSNFAKMKSGDIDPGMTTEVAALLLYGLGAYVVIGSMIVAVVVGGAMAVLLQFKKPLHTLAGAIGERDMRAIMQFVLLSLVILPVLPHQDFGPYGVWNPFQIWLMVVLIVGISLTGYIAYKCLGTRRGTLLAGVLGGLISSTATTVSYARRTVENTNLANLATVVIVIASCVSLGRVLVEMAAVAPVAFASMAPPVAAILAVSIIIAAAIFLWQPSRDTQMPEQKNPAELKTAFIFAAIYAVVLVAVAVAKEHFGAAGFYTVAIVSGLTDMDAITLSSARLVESGRADPSTGWHAILIAAMSNLVFKFGTVSLLGDRSLTLRIAAVFGLILTCGGVVLWFWPV